MTPEPPLRVQQVRVEQIRPEEGLGRKRDRQGHQDLCRSIDQFGVLTPVTVRQAPDGTGDYLLIKGQGRTLACRLLGIKTIPAVVVSNDFADQQKVQQFLVENVARLKMRPVDRALLIARARRDGEETADVARRFGVSAATVRRLQGQLEHAGSGEVAALRSGLLNLSLHAVIARHISPCERDQVVQLVRDGSIRSKELESLLIGIGWQALSALDSANDNDRLELLRWCIDTLSHLPGNLSMTERLRRLAISLPLEIVNTRATLDIAL